MTNNKNDKKGLSELIEERRPRSRRYVDPLDDVLLNEERDLAREHKRLRLEALIEKRRREVQKMREGVIDDGPLPSNTDFLNMAKFLADLSPDESARVRNAYSFLKLTDKGGGSGLNVLPMLLNYARQNPNASEGQMVQYLTLMNSQFTKGLEVAKATNPKQDGSLELLKIFTELMKTSFIKPMEELAKNIQPQQGILEQMMTNPQLRLTMKELGMFGSSNAATSEFDLKIEQIRGERFLQAKKWELETHRAELKRQDDDRRTDTLLTLFAPVAGAIAGLSSERMRELGRQTATHNPMSPKVMPQLNAIQLLCSCGYQGSMPVMDPPQSEIKCPECGLMLQVNPTPKTPVKEENEDERYV